MKKILLVDDFLTVRTFEKVALGNGFEFLEAADGQAALVLAESASPDVILMDVMMPKMDGITALKELKSRPRTKNIPVIMVTTKSEDDVPSRCRALGCAAMLFKPTDGTTLREEVDRALSGNSHG